MEMTSPSRYECTPMYRNSVSQERLPVLNRGPGIVELLTAYSRRQHPQVCFMAFLARPVASIA